MVYKYPDVKVETVDRAVGASVALPHRAEPDDEDALARADLSIGLTQ